EVPVAELGVVLQTLRAGDVHLGDLLADVARARVQRDPHTAVAVVHAQLREMVAAAHRAQLRARLLLPLLHRLRQGGETLPELLEPVARAQACELTGGERLLMRREADGDRRLDRGAQSAEVFEILL